MKTILIEKYKLWTSERCDNFHNNVIRDDIEGKYVWESDSNGVFLIRNSGCHYLTHDGKIYILTMVGNDSDFANHVKLYNQITSCRIDIPIVCETFQMNSCRFFYKEFIRPNGEFGRDYHLDIFDNKVDDKYFLQYVIDSATIMAELRKFDGPLPKVGMSPFKRMHDSKGVFFSDFKDWSVDYDQYVKTSLQTLEIVTYYLNVNKLTNLNIPMLVQEAKLLWNLK